MRKLELEGYKWSSGENPTKRLEWYSDEFVLVITGKKLTWGNVYHLEEHQPENYNIMEVYHPKITNANKY